MHKLVNGVKVELTPEEEAQVVKMWENNAIEIAKTQYVSDRVSAYPPITDQLDAVLKQLNYMQMNKQTDLIAPMDDIIQQWLKVKRDFPKPGE